jgi:[protein-PII] uridylyltransferase
LQPEGLERLGEGSPEAFAALKDSQRADRAALLSDLLRAFPRGPDSACQRLTEHSDRWIAGVAAVPAFTLPGGVCLVACGGYARAELCPGSDLDLCVVARDDATLGAASVPLSALLRALWDLGLPISHTVRTLAEVGELFRSDLPGFSALCTIRRIAGDPEVERALACAVDAALARHGREFLALKQEEREALVGRYGARAFSSQPHLKAGAGGLRDLELLGFAERVGDELAVAALSPADCAAARRVRLDLRFGLHALEGGKQDRFTAETAHAVHDRLSAGDPDPPSLRERMRGFFRGSGAIDRAVRMIGGEPVVTAADFELTPTQLREVLRDPAPSHPRIEELLRCGALARCVPEIAGIVGLWLSDPYHAFTVCEHSLEVLRAFEAFSDEPPSPEADRRRRVLARVDSVRNRELLRLTSLVHDAGKAGVGDHAELGRELATRVAERLGLAPSEHRTLRFLVGQHMLLSLTADRRDVERDETIVPLAAAVPDLEHLDLLYLFTIADGRGVAARALPRWRDGLIGRVFERTRQMMLGTGGGAVSSRGVEEAYEEETLAALLKLEPGLSPTEAARAYADHLALLAGSYHARVEPWTCARHIAPGRRLEAGEDPAVLVESRGSLEHVTVVTRDRPGLLAALAGAVAACRASIVTASATTRADGVCFDELTVAPQQDELRVLEIASLQAALARCVREVLLKGVSPHALIESAARRVGARLDPPRGPVARSPRVRISNELSSADTVIEVSAPDRTGLLFDLARGLASQGIAIRDARISTRGARATDVFYVTRGGAKIPKPEHPGLQAAVLESLSRTGPLPLP